MTEYKLNGGPVFPSQTKRNLGNPIFGGVETTYHRGINLRQYYAGQALIGELASQSPESGLYPHDEQHANLLAERCVAFADAIIQKLNKE